MFKRKKQAAPQPRPPPLPPPPSQAQRRAVPRLTISECLQQAQSALQRLRSLNPGDLQAFPLLNEIQRLVQQLKEATAPLPPADREAWSFQIADLEDEFRELADVVVSRADAAPKPEPRLASTSTASTSYGSGNRSSATAALLSPSNSGRVQQAVALFSRQDGFTNGSGNGGGVRRMQTVYTQQQHQQRPMLAQQQAPQHSYAVEQEPQQQQQSQHQQQYQQQYQHAVEQSYSQTAGSAASTPARSESSYVYLSEEERQLLAQKQHALLHKHFKYLTQQREAQGHGVDQHSTAVSVQQLESAAAQQQAQAVYQYQQRAPYQQEQQQRSPATVQAAPMTAAADPNQAPAWTAPGMDAAMDGDQTPTATARAVPTAAAGGATAGYGSQPAVYAQAQHEQQGLLPAGAQQRTEDQDVGLGPGGDDDDLFSGLDVAVAEEHSYVAQSPQPPTNGATTSQRSVNQAQQQQQQQQPPPAALGASGAAHMAGPGGNADPRDSVAQMQRAAAYNFRPAGHSMPHRFYAGSQLGPRAEGAVQSQQEIPPEGPGSIAEQPAAGPAAEPVEPSQSQGMPTTQQQQQQQGWSAHYPQNPLSLGVEPLAVQRQDQQQLQLHTGVQQQQQQTAHKRQLSAHGYQLTRATADMSGNAAGVLASPSWRGVPGTAHNQSSPFSQAPRDVPGGSGPMAATSAVDGAASFAYSARNQVAHVQLGYGGIDVSSSQGSQLNAVVATIRSRRHHSQSSPPFAVVALPPFSEPQPLAGSAVVSDVGTSRIGGEVGYSGQVAPQHQFVPLAGYHQQGAFAARSATPVAVGQVDASAYGQALAPVEQLAQPPQHGLQYVQQQQQQHGHGGQSQLPGQLLVESGRYPQIQAQDAQQPSLQHANHLQQQHPVIPPAQQQPANSFMGTYADPGRYPQVWPHEGGTSAMAQAAQQQQHAQQHNEARAAHAVSRLSPDGQRLIAEEQLPLPPLPPHPVQQLSQAELYLQQARQYRQLQQQSGQERMPAWSRPDNVEPAAQTEREPRVEPPVQAYLPALLPQTPEEQARTQLLQQITDSMPPASMGVRPGQQLYASGGGGGAVASNGRPQVPEAAGSVHSSFERNSSPKSVANGVATAAYAAVRGVELVTGSPAVGPSPTLAGAPKAYPVAATVTARSSPNVSAFMQSAQNATEALAGSATPPRHAAFAGSSITGGASPGASTTATAGTPMHAVAAATHLPAAAHQQQPGIPADAGGSGRSPVTPSTSLPLSSGAARSRSRGLVSGGGGTSSGGLMPDPAASLPSLSSLPNLVDLEAFLDNITGSVDACHTAAEHRARDMVAALGAALSQAQKVEASVQQQRRAVKAALAGVVASIAQLESDQAAAVEGEDFETAAALDEQLSLLSSRQAHLDEQVQVQAQALQRTAALRLQVLGRQAEVWRTTGAYLIRLQSGQQQIAAAMATQAEREAQAAGMLHRAAQEAVVQRRATLHQRNSDLEHATAEVSAQVATATAPAEAERLRRVRARDALQADVESLRALLAAKEAELAAAEVAVAESVEAVRQQAAAYDHDLARLEEERRQLEAEAAQLAGHEQALQESERQAEVRAAAVEEHQSRLKVQADALGAAGEAMRCEAEALSQRVEAEARNQEQRERLLQADEKAREDLKGLERCISDLSADLSRLSEQRGRLAAERAAAQDSLAGLQRSIPELEAAKRAAAANKDFREAARLSGELRALSSQADVAAAQLARVTAAMSELAAAESGKVSELEELRAMIHEAQRHAAEAHHRYLVFTLSLSRAALEEAVSAELYEEAGALQAEVTAEEVEVMALERTWGFIRPAQATSAAAAAAARRRTSLEASTAAAAAALQGQYSRQSLGSLSAQSSRSMSAQLPSAQAVLHQQVHPQPAAQAAAFKGAPAASVGGALVCGMGGTPGLHTDAASPTGVPIWQQPQQLSQPQQAASASAFAAGRRSGRTVSDDGDGGGVTAGGSHSLVSPRAAQMPVPAAALSAGPPTSPGTYTPPPPQPSAASPAAGTAGPLRHVPTDAGPLQAPTQQGAHSAYTDALEASSVPGPVLYRTALDQSQAATQAVYGMQHLEGGSIQRSLDGLPVSHVTAQQPQQEPATGFPYATAGPVRGLPAQTLSAESSRRQLEAEASPPAGRVLPATQFPVGGSLVGDIADGSVAAPSVTAVQAAAVLASPPPVRAAGGPRLSTDGSKLHPGDNIATTGPHGAAAQGQVFFADPSGGAGDVAESRSASLEKEGAAGGVTPDESGAAPHPYTPPYGAAYNDQHSGVGAPPENSMRRQEAGGSRGSVASSGADSAGEGMNKTSEFLPDVDGHYAPSEALAPGPQEEANVSTVVATPLPERPGEDEVVPLAMAHPGKIGH